eukprot:COSAG04_NODE_1031_length_8627_cov_10.660765_7_plen_49_part_00
MVWLCLCQAVSKKMEELQSKFQSQGERFKKPYMKTLIQVRHTTASDQP